MERLGPSYFRDASPEVELVVREVNSAAAEAASRLASTWDRRATIDVLDLDEDEAAMFAVVGLEKLNDSLPSAEFASMPFLPEARPNWDPGRTLDGEFADLRALLPFVDDELAILRGGLLALTQLPEGMRPKATDYRLRPKFSDWLRQPADEDGIYRPRPEALAAHTLCVRLYGATKEALPSHDVS
jgi:hypothetical protein